MTFDDLDCTPADNPMFITSAMSDALNWDFAMGIGQTAPPSLDWANNQAVTDWYGAYCGV